MYSLIQEAEKYTSLSYKVGLASGKLLVDLYKSGTTKVSSSWDGISLILDGIVCVDFDTDFYDLGYGYDLPPTLKEKTPRGYHLFYSLKDPFIIESKINWRPKVDLLVRSKKTVKYGAKKVDLLTEHVLVAPTPNYVRVYPDITPPRKQLTEAPDWLMEAIAI